MDVLPHGDSVSSKDSFHRFYSLLLREKGDHEVVDEELALNNANALEKNSRSGA